MKARPLSGQESGLARHSQHGNYEVDALVRHKTRRSKRKVMSIPGKSLQPR